MTIKKSLAKLDETIKEVSKWMTATDRQKIAAVRKFRSSVAESTRNEGQQCRRGDCIERRQCNYLLKLLLGRRPTKQEIDQALHLDDMD